MATAKGSYKGEFVEANYQLGMRYNSLHGIEQKELIHTVNQQQKGYVLDYSYKDAAHPHAVSAVEEVGKSVARTYSYDGNGNPLSYTEDQSFRKFSWDEENRLMGINDNGELHQYTYDHSGERVIKSKSDAQKVSVNGQASASMTHSDGYTGYVNPYFVISKGKFTKHYFDGASRVVSKLGNGVFRQPIGITAGGVNYTKLTEAQQKALDEYIRKLGVPPGPPTQQGIYGTPEYTGMPYPSLPLEEVKESQEPPQGWPRNPRFNEKGDVPGPPAQFGPPVSPEKVEAGEGFVGTGLPEQNIYYLHSDHLGSTSYITTQNGSISQHVEYMAFGEVLYEEHSSSFVSPYLYNAKELDRDTGLYYYGARYYDPKVSVFLNVDPLAEQTMEPYAYVGNNPVMFVDPTGMASEESDDWVHYKDNNGKNQFIYDRDIKTVEQAKEKGYHNVQSVSNQIELKSGTENYKLSENATVTDLNTNKTVNTGFNLSDGSYVGENNMLKASAEGLQEGGDLMFYGGIGAMATSNPIGVAVGSASVSVGGVMSTTGSVLDIVNDIVDNKFSIEKTITKFTLFLIARPFGKLGTSKLENSMNDALIDGFDKVLDYARDKEVGPYKKGF